MYPVVVDTVLVGAEVELQARNPASIVGRPDSAIMSEPEPITQAPPLLRTSTGDFLVAQRPQRTKLLRRGSSFVLVSSDLWKLTKNLIYVTYFMAHYIYDLTSSFKYHISHIVRSLFSQLTY